MSFLDQPPVVVILVGIGCDLGGEEPIRCCSNTVQMHAKSRVGPVVVILVGIGCDLGAHTLL